MVRVGFLFLAGCAALAQPASDLEFEAASVKLVTSARDGRAIGSRYDPGQYRADYVTMRDLIAEAYAVQTNSKITGPDWINSDSTVYVINAKTPGQRNYREVRVMLQHLLASRFQLKLHTVERTTPAYALVVGSKGLKLTPVKFEGDPSQGAIHPVVSGSDVKPGALKTEFKHTSMKMFAGYLNNWGNFGRPVTDETGVTDLFDFDLTYAAKGFQPLLNPPPDNDKPTIIEAVQALGLKLETRQGKVTDYVIDHVEREPVEN